MVCVQSIELKLAALKCSLIAVVISPLHSQSSEGLSILVAMPGGRKFYPPRSWSTVLLEVMLVVLLIVLVWGLLSQLHWLR
jgi:hypothetical protein